MNHFGQDGTQKNITEKKKKNGLKKILKIVMEREKIKTVGKKVQVDLFLTMMFIWNLTTDGLIGEISLVIMNINNGAILSGLKLWPKHIHTGWLMLKI